MDHFNSPVKICPKMDRIDITNYQDEDQGYISTFFLPPGGQVSVAPTGLREVGRRLFPRLKSRGYYLSPRGGSGKDQ